MNDWAPLFSCGDVREMIITRFEFRYIHRGTPCDYMLTVLCRNDDVFDIAVETSERIAELVRDFEPDSIRAEGGAEAFALVASLERERGGTLH